MELEFVFSFRSPYARFAAVHSLPLLPSGTTVRWRPFFPLPQFSNFPPLLPAKTRYLVRDVQRLCKLYDLPLHFPSVDDPDWAIPHSAFVAAEEQGSGSAFGLALFEARWARGENLAHEATLRVAAESVGLDADGVLHAAHDGARKAALTQQVLTDYEERGIFGVPTLILPRGTRYWGHDRIELAIAKGWVQPGPH